MQNSDRHNDISIQPSRTKRADQSVSMTYKPASSYGVQQNVSVRNQSNQLSQNSQQDEGMQIEADVREEGIQP
jgi:hypothetical protein